MTSQVADVVIVGGGIWGLSAAFHLSQLNAGRIVLIERNAELARETTEQAAGQIGQLRTDPVMVAAIRYALELGSSFAERFGVDPCFTQTGSLHLALEPTRLAALVQQIPNASKMGIEVSQVEAAEIHELAPHVQADQVVGGLYLPSDAYVDARSNALAFATVAEQFGVEFNGNTTLRELQPLSEGGYRLVTDRQTWQTRQVICTAGPWVARLANSWGPRIPAVAIRLQQARTVPDPDLSPLHPVLRIPDASCYLRPEAGGYLFGSFDPEPWVMDAELERSEFRTNDLLPAADLVSRIQQRLRPLLPAIMQMPLAQYRQGWVTCSPDARYVVGPLEPLPGVWVATGCGGMGIAGAAGIGRWLAEWVVQGQPSVDLKHFSPHRFDAAPYEDAELRQKCGQVFSQYYALRSATYLTSQ